MRILLSALSVLAICSCPGWARDTTTPPALGDTPDGGEHSPAANPNKAEDRFQSENRPKSDEMLATAVHDGLAHDSRVNSMQVRVSAREGVVRLSGTVPRQADRDAAEDVARKVAGVRDVNNDIVVDSNPAGPGQSPIPERTRP
jgi:hyperosmotically inducible protein